MERRRRIVGIVMLVFLLLALALSLDYILVTRNTNARGRVVRSAPCCRRRRNAARPCGACGPFGRRGGGRRRSSRGRHRAGRSARRGIARVPLRRPDRLKAVGGRSRSALVRPGLFRDPAAAFFVRGVAVFRRRSRFGDPGKEENFRSGPAPRALPCAASCVDVCARHGPRSVGDAYAGGVVRAASRAHGRHMFAPAPRARPAHVRPRRVRRSARAVSGVGRLAPRALVGSHRVRGRLAPYRAPPRGAKGRFAREVFFAL